MSKDKLNIKITMTSDGKKFSLVKGKRRDCGGCAFEDAPPSTCPTIEIPGHFGCLYPCRELGGGFVWKEITK